MMLGLLLGGNFIPAVSGLIVTVIFLGVMIQVISGYMICILTLYIMAYVSPIFVPMILFQRTKGYFDAWLRICVSCALQPAIMLSFVAFMLGMFDIAMYDNCLFKKQEYSIPLPAISTDYSSSSSSAVNNIQSRDINTFRMMLPESDPQKCQNSLGYFLNKAATGNGWKSLGLLLVEIHFLPADFWGEVNGVYSMIKVVLFSFIFYFFSKSISSFASEITGGPNLGSVTNSIGGIVDKAMDKNEKKKDKQEEKKRQGSNKSAAKGKK
jgi:type IV secretion system protein VirB6